MWGVRGFVAYRRWASRSPPGGDWLLEVSPVKTPACPGLSRELASSVRRRGCLGRRCPSRPTLGRRGRGEWPESAPRAGRRSQGRSGHGRDRRGMSGRRRSPGCGDLLRRGVEGSAVVRPRSARTVGVAVGMVVKSVMLRGVSRARKAGRAGGLPGDAAGKRLGALTSFERS